MTANINLDYWVELPEPDNVDELEYISPYRVHDELVQMKIARLKYNIWLEKQDWFTRFRIGAYCQPEGFINRLTKAIREML